MKKHNTKDYLRNTIAAIAGSALLAGCAPGFHLDKGLREESITPYVPRSEINFYLKNQDRFNFYAHKKDDKVIHVVIDPNDEYDLYFFDSNLKEKDWKKTDASELEGIVKKRPDLKKVSALSWDVPCLTNRERVQRTAIAYKVGENENYQINVDQYKYDPNKFFVSVKKRLKIDGGDGSEPGEPGEPGGPSGGAGGVGGNGAGPGGGAGGSGGSGGTR